FDGLSVELLRQADGAVVSAVGHEDRRATVGHQVACGELAHLACANDKDFLALQRSENLLREFDRNRSNRHRRCSDGSLAAHALGDGKGAAEELVELSADSAHSARGCIGFFYLPENLRLAHDHRVETRSYAENMAHRVLLAEFIKMGIKHAGIEVEVVVQEPAQISVTVHRVRDDL